MKAKKNSILYNFSAYKRYLITCFEIFAALCQRRVGITNSSFFKKAQSSVVLKNLLINGFLLREYTVFFIFILVCFALSALLYFVAKNINKKIFYAEKSAPYECGFEAFSDARGRINVHFYVVALLFVIFDVEVIYFLPWAVNFFSLGFPGYFAMIAFNVFLVAGFTYEWCRGAFNWTRPSSVVCSIQPPAPPVLVKKIAKK